MSFRNSPSRDSYEYTNTDEPTPSRWHSSMKGASPMLDSLRNHGGHGGRQRQRSYPTFVEDSDESLIHEKSNAPVASASLQSLPTSTASLVHPLPRLSAYREGRLARLREGLEKEDLRLAKLKEAMDDITAKARLLAAPRSLLSPSPPSRTSVTSSSFARRGTASTSEPLSRTRGTSASLPRTSRTLPPYSSDLSPSSPSRQMRTLGLNSPGASSFTSRSPAPSRFSTISSPRLSGYRHHSSAPLPSRRRPSLTSRTSVASPYSKISSAWRHASPTHTDLSFRHPASPDHSVSTSVIKDDSNFHHSRRSSKQSTQAWEEEKDFWTEEGPTGKFGEKLKILAAQEKEEERQNSVDIHRPDVETLSEELERANNGMIEAMRKRQREDVKAAEFSLEPAKKRSTPNREARPLSPTSARQALMEEIRGVVKKNVKRIESDEWRFHGKQYTLNESKK